MNQPQEGLGQPVAQQTVQEAPLFIPNPAITQRRAKMTGEQQQREGQIAMAAAQTAKAQTEAEIMQQMQASQQVDPVQDLAGAIMNQQVSQEQLAQIDPRLVQAAMQLVQQSQQPAGLGQINPQDYLV